VALACCLARPACADTIDLTADLLVVGGTESGCAAAVQAARMGVTNIVLVNDITWVGGQFSAEALGAIDENRAEGYSGTTPIPRSGLFREVMDRIETLNGNKYAGVSRPGNTRVITTSLPADSEQVFRDLLAPHEASGHVVRYSNYYPTQAIVSVGGTNLEGVVFGSDQPGATSLSVRAAVTIDASDWGDVIRLSGAAYEFGPDLQQTYGEPQAPTSRVDFPVTDMNPITYCMIVVEQTNDTPIPLPLNYNIRDFTEGRWRGLGHSHAYTSRRLVDHYGFPQIDHPDAILLNNPHVDYPLEPLPQRVIDALEALEPGASTNNICEMTRAQRRVIFDDAKNRSLCYLYYLQNTIHSNLTDKSRSFRHFALSEEFGTPDRLPFKPYVRESLRLKAMYVVRQQDALGWSSSGTQDHRAFANSMFHDAVMSWQFLFDFHPTRRVFGDPGDPAGPWTGNFRGDRSFGGWDSGRAVFPLRGLIPKRVNGLLGAQKNLGYTSIVSSSCRLHDQSMAIGQAAGAAAAVAIEEGVSLRTIPWDIALMIRIWRGLLSREAGAMPVALWPFADIPPEHEAFVAVNQLAVRGLVPMGPYDVSFRADDAPDDAWLSALSNRVVAAGYVLPPTSLSPPPATRGAAAASVWAAVSAQADPPWPRLDPQDADLDGLLDADDPLPFNTNTVYWTLQIPALEDGLPDGMSYRMQIVFSNCVGAVPLTNFPALVVLEEGMRRFQHGQLQPGGTDLRFTRDDGVTLTNHEIDQWGGGATSSLVWVQVPVLTNGATIWAYWGNALLTDHHTSQTDGSVWSVGFDGVWHMSEVNPPNSAFGGVDGTAHGTVALTGGEIGTALYFANTGEPDPSPDYVTVNGVGRRDPEVLTISEWVKADTGAKGVVYAHRGEAVRLVQLTVESDSNARLQLRGNSNVLHTVSKGGLDLTEWTHLAGVFDNRSNRHILYVNGLPVGTNTTDFGRQTFASDRQTIGTHYSGGYADGFEGTIDEVRLSGVVRSSDWLRTSYLTVASNAWFAACGKAQPTEPGSLLVVK